MNEMMEKMERLNHQIDFLNKENHNLEEELKALKKDSSRVQQLRTEIEDLKKKSSVFNEVRLSYAPPKNFPNTNTENGVYKLIELKRLYGVPLEGGRNVPYSTYNVPNFQK